MEAGRWWDHYVLFGQMSREAKTCQIHIDVLSNATGDVITNVFDFTEEKLERAIRLLEDPYEKKYVSDCLTSYREGKTVIKWSKGRFIPVSMKYYIAMLNTPDDESVIIDACL